MNRIFLATFFLVVAFGFAPARVAQFTLDNAKCRLNNHQANDEFLAYCNYGSYADYEHGALYYDLESSVSENIHNAEVIFFGNSLTQVSFSTKFTRSFFEERGIKYFIMGWGYSELGRFADAVIKKWRASPRVIVINADPFFSQNASPPAQAIIDGSIQSKWDVFLHFAYQRLHPVVCRLPLICAGSADPNRDAAIYRSAADGQWNVGTFWINDGAAPIAIQARKPLSDAEMASATELGQKFLNDLGIDRRCVVLTGIPSSNTDGPAAARTLARSLGTRLILLDIPDLATVDGGHLNRPSSERWSKEFLTAMTPILNDCIPGNARAD